MAATDLKTTDENTFLDQLTDQLNRLDNVEWKKSSKDGYDISVEDKSTDKKIFIEFKGGGKYGELPISSIISLAGFVKNNPDYDKFFLLTFSKLSGLLQSKLDELDVQTITQPKVDEVVNQVKLALAS